MTTISPTSCRPATQAILDRLARSYVNSLPTACLLDVVYSPADEVYTVGYSTPERGWVPLRDYSTEAQALALMDAMLPHLAQEPEGDVGSGADAADEGIVGHGPLAPEAWEDMGDAYAAHVAQEAAQAS